MHVVVDSTLDPLLVAMQGSLHGFPIHHEEEGRDEDYDEDSRQAVTPDVNAFVVKHKQAPEYFSGSVKVDSISMGDVVVIFHEARGCLVVPYVVLGYFSHYFFLGLGLLCLFFWISH